MGTVVPNMAPGLLAFIAAVFVLAGAVKGVVGLGLPTISMALLALRMAPTHAAALLIVPSLATNLWQAGPLPTLGPLLRRIGLMQVGVCIGTLAGACAFGAAAGDAANVLLGVALVAYAAWGLFGRAPGLRASTERWLGPLLGALTGVIAAATGVFVVPAVPYLQALALGRDGLIQAMGVSFTVSTIALAAALCFTGDYSLADAGTSVLMLVPALLGMYAGTRMRGLLSPNGFRLYFFISLALLGLYQIAQVVS